MWGLGNSFGTNSNATGTEREAPMTRWLLEVIPERAVRP
jgi:hypothetical protein